MTDQAPKSIADIYLPTKDFEKNGEADPEKIFKLVGWVEKAERYDDMCYLLHELIKLKKGDLTENERNLLSVGFKNVVGQLRNSWRNIDEQKKTAKMDSESKTASHEDQQKGKKDYLALEPYGQILTDQIISKCEQVVGLLGRSVQNPDGIEIPPESAEKTPDQEKVQEKAIFYLKMKGDYYRYMAEVSPGEWRDISTGEDTSYGAQASSAYEAAFKRAETHLAETHPTRLGLALNRSVCFYEIQREPKKACKVAKAAFDQAIQKLDTLNDDTYKDSTLIMQLLRDNLTLWTSEDQANANVEDAED